MHLHTHLHPAAVRKTRQKTETCYTKHVTSQKTDERRGKTVGSGAVPTQVCALNPAKTLSEHME